MVENKEEKVEVEVVVVVVVRGVVRGSAVTMSGSDERLALFASVSSC